MNMIHNLRRASRVAALMARNGPAPVRMARTAIREHGAMQRTWELASLISRVAELRPGVVVEIGTHRGGTLRCWAATAAADALLVSIDLPNPAEGMGTRPDDLLAVRRALQPAQTLAEVTGDSHLPETRDRLVEILAGQSVDFLWIDGDHSEAGVRQDWALYSGLVRPGGIAALHDIHPNPELPGNQVQPLWRELKRRHPGKTAQFIDQDQAGGRGCGIGVVRL
ncbi:class I SAM-dependent methyltransferase [Longimicrobium terrae]|uniref:Putative O-methyltransferase YrrM n=1 Tax=Longimicrobium terrae TaxID=1639882 RepID=A0A841H129_9BACT|nr:class I SAM-dependent methyltransferase [Longimicrobium terrae]MBB4637319.1 putative O-methyltransferase YrrM [Longimicrobium terrae]MBB6071717.1 putative O-methyltransferase YrrM [Longimicrobium terrae]NNC28478.1 class I SAM-dependent methyltransferase [Longimicrobium terrae]